MELPDNKEIRKITEQSLPILDQMYLVNFRFRNAIYGHLNDKMVREEEYNQIMAILKNQLWGILGLNTEV